MGWGEEGPSGRVVCIFWGEEENLTKEKEKPEALMPEEIKKNLCHLEKNERRRKV